MKLTNKVKHENIDTKCTCCTPSDINIDGITVDRLVNNSDSVLLNDVIKNMEREYPLMTYEFRKIMQEQYELFIKKQNDYGPSNISMGSNLDSKEDVRLSLTGLAVRLNDKIQRLINLVIKKNMEGVQNESLEDTFRDISIYGIIAQLVQKQIWGK